MRPSLNAAAAVLAEPSAKKVLASPTLDQAKRADFICAMSVGLKGADVFETAEGKALLALLAALAGRSVASREEILNDVARQLALPDDKLKSILDMEELARPNTHPTLCQRRSADSRAATAVRLSTNIRKLPSSLVLLIAKVRVAVTRAYAASASSGARRAAAAAPG